MVIQKKEVYYSWYPNRSEYIVFCVNVKIVLACQSAPVTMTKLV